MAHGVAARSGLNRIAPDEARREQAVTELTDDAQLK